LSPCCWLTRPSLGLAGLWISTTTQSRAWLASHGLPPSSMCRPYHAVSVRARIPALPHPVCLVASLADSPVAWSRRYLDLGINALTSVVGVTWPSSLQYASPLACSERQSTHPQARCRTPFALLPRWLTRPSLGLAGIWISTTTQSRAWLASHGLPPSGTCHP
jgi:hypothetical protein